MVLNRLGWFSVRHHRSVLLLAVVTVVIAGGVGAGVLSSLTPGGFVDPQSQSEQARLVLLRDFHEGPPNAVVLVTARRGDVDSPDVAAAGAGLTRRVVAEPGVEQVWSYFSPASPRPLRSRDGHRALIFVRLGGGEDDVQRAVERLSPAATFSTPVISSRVGGPAEVARQGREQVRHDLERAELVSAPVLLLLLVLVFGSLLAGILPLAIGLMSVISTLLVLRLVACVTDVSLFAVNLTTALGLGLAIDYSLLIVTRYREEGRRGLRHRDAVVRAVETAGRTVLFSAATVAASLSALLVFPTVFLRSFAYAGIAVVVLSTGAAVVVLPALLAVFGPHLDRWMLHLSRRATARHRRVGPGFWQRLAWGVMHRPVLAGGSVLLLLLVLGTPFFGVKFGMPDHRVLPAHASAREVQDAIDQGFVRGEGNDVLVVGTGHAATTASPAQVAGYATELSALPGVARVDAAPGSYIDGRRVAPPLDGGTFAGRHGTWLAVVPAVEPLSPDGERLVHDVRELRAPFPVLVGGAPAQLVDTKEALFGRLPLALGLIAIVTFCVLFLFTGSLLVPIKGLVLNLLSLTATFGAMVWVFQDGRFAGVLDFTPTGTLDSNMPILMFCVAFGLSMDYEVFLLSRIKEHYDRYGDNEQAVAFGLQSTGRLVTSAAALLAAVFLAFATSGISFIKLLGIGTALAVVMDATLVRGILVPAFMRLAGDANWWAPAPLRALHGRLRLSEGDLLPPTPDLPASTSSYQRADARPTMSAAAGTSSPSPP